MASSAESIILFHSFKIDRCNQSRLAFRFGTLLLGRIVYSIKATLEFVTTT
jgi:hypothetical protein